MLNDDLTRCDKVFGFFMYCYLGVNLESDTEDIVDAVIKRAYQDAASHVLSIPNEDEKINRKNEAMKIIKKEILQLQRKDLDYDTWH